VTDRQPFRFDWPADETSWDMRTGAPGIILVANAIQVWSSFQPGEKASVAEAARAFNIEPIKVIEACDSHHYLYLEGPRDDYARLFIGHDGE
jgi:hypothetical protein